VKHESGLNAIEKSTCNEHTTVCCIHLSAGGLQCKNQRHPASAAHLMSQRSAVCHSPATTQGIQQGGAEYWSFCGIRGLRSRRAQRGRSAPRSGPAPPRISAARGGRQRPPATDRPRFVLPNCELS
jgi:hypothetical protein